MRRSRSLHYQDRRTVPLYRRLGGPKGQSGRVRKISPLPQGFDPHTVQPVASPYTDYVVDLLNVIFYIFKPTRIHDASLKSEISFLNIFTVSTLRTERCNPLSCKIRIMNDSLKDISIEIWLDSNMFLSSDTQCFSVPLLGPFLAAKHTKVIYCRV